MRLVTRDLTITKEALAFSDIKVDKLHAAAAILDEHKEAMKSAEIVKKNCNKSVTLKKSVAFCMFGI